MRNRRAWGTAVLFLSLGASFGTRGAHAQDVTVPLTQNKIQAEVLAEQAQRERADRPTSSLEFGASTWEPRDLQISSRLDGTSEFKRSGAPALQFNVIQPLSSDVSLKGGVSFLSMTRSAELNTGGISTQETEAAYIPSAVLGAEYAPIAFSTKTFRPYLTAGLMPTLIMTDRSAFDDGQTDYGFPFFGGAGTMIHLAKSWDANVGITQVLGKVNNSDLSGFGINAAVRVAL